MNSLQFCETERSNGFAFDENCKSGYLENTQIISYKVQLSQNFRERYEVVLVENGISKIFYCSQMAN